MYKKQIENKTFEYHQSGFHCAESILKAFEDFYGKEADTSIVKYASGFGGGIGGFETCGALTGGIVVIGWLFGRLEPSSNNQKVSMLAAEFRNRFNEKFGFTICREIKNSPEFQSNKQNCKKLTAQTAGILYDLVKEMKEKHHHAESRDV